MNEKVKKLYMRVLNSLELLGWNEEWIANDGFAVYSRKLGDEEFVLNIDQNSIVVRDKGTLMLYYESPEVKNLRWEVEAMEEWLELQEAIKEEAAA